MQPTRRQLLAGLGAGSLGLGLGFGWTSLATGRPQFRHYTYAATDGPDARGVRVAWYERYNGVFQEAQAGAADPGLADATDPDTLPAYTDAGGPVLTVGNVLPGDEGSLVVGLEVSDGEEPAAEPLDIWLQTRLTSDAENGTNGPERAAGDTTPDGDLDEELLVELWRDGAPLGSCNGRKDFTEQLEGPIVARSPVRVGLGPASDVGDGDGQRLFRAVAPGESRCVALSWQFPESSATNRSQGDSVGFDLVFAGTSASASPFGGSR